MPSEATPAPPAGANDDDDGDFYNINPEACDGMSASLQYSNRMQWAQTASGTFALLLCLVVIAVIVAGRRDRALAYRVRPLYTTAAAAAVLARLYAPPKHSPFESQRAGIVGTLTLFSVFCAHTRSPSTPPPSRARTSRCCWPYSSPTPSSRSRTSSRAGCCTRRARCVATSPSAAPLATSTGAASRG